MNLQQRKLCRFYQTLPQAEDLLTRADDFHWAKVFPWGLGDGFKIATPIHALEQGDDWIREFTKVYGPALVMPLTLLDKGLGFGARSIKDKRFSSNLFQVPGFYSSASCFREPFTYGTPIILTEGVLDAEVVSLAYPWVLATLTSKVSEPQAFLLSCLTNTVVFSFDNDEAGEKGRRYSTKYLKKWGIRWTDLRPSGKVSDWGDLLSLPREEMQNELNRYSVTLRTKGIVRD